MKLFVCTRCGRTSFVRRCVCPDCLSEEFRESECTEPVERVSSVLNVTPPGFEDILVLVMGTCNGSAVIYEKPVENS